MVYIYIPNSCSTFWPKTGRLWRFRRLWWLLTSRLVAFWALWCSMGHSAHCKVLVQFSSCQGKYNEVTYLYISKDRNNDAKKGERWCWLPIDGWGDKARSSSSSFLEITCELGLLSHFWFSAWLHTSAPVSSKKYQKAWQKWKHENGQKIRYWKRTCCWLVFFWRITPIFLSRFCRRGLRLLSAFSSCWSTRCWSTRATIKFFLCSSLIIIHRWIVNVKNLFWVEHQRQPVDVERVRDNVIVLACKRALKVQQEES